MNYLVRQLGSDGWLFNSKRSLFTHPRFCEDVRFFLEVLVTDFIFRRIAALLLKLVLGFINKLLFVYKLGLLALGHIGNLAVIVQGFNTKGLLHQVEELLHIGLRYTLRFLLSWLRISDLVCQPFSHGGSFRWEHFTFLLTYPPSTANVLCSRFSPNTFGWSLPRIFIAPFFASLGNLLLILRCKHLRHFAL